MSNAAFDRIHAEIAANDVVLYLRGTPAYPLCGGSAAIVQILEHLGIKYRAVDVNADFGINGALRQFADWPTLPQLYVKAQFLGGPEIVEEMYATGALHALLRERGIMAS